MRFTIRAILVATIVVAVALAGFRFMGVRGIAPVWTVISLVWFILSRIPNSALYPLSKEPLTVVELVVLVAIGLVLQGLLIPAT